jgi:hypothetical protein
VPALIGRLSVTARPKAQALFEGLGHSLVALASSWRLTAMPPFVDGNYMSRLDSFIRRLEAQRLILNWSAAAVSGREGLVLELGLGNGRTYDHLREILPEREIYAFEREAKANPRSLPPADRLILGDMAQTLPQFAGRHGRSGVLVHVDATTGVPERDAVALAWLPGHVTLVAADDAVVISGSALPHTLLEEMPLPEGIQPGRYFAYRRRPAAE